MLLVLWPAGKPQRFTLAAVPKGIRFRVKKSSAHGAGREKISGVYSARE